MGYILKASNAKGESGLNRYISMLAGNTNTPVITDTGAMFPIQMVNVGSTGVSTIDFTSIPDTYKHLQIRGVGVLSGSSNGYFNLPFRINGDTGNNYARHGIRASGSGSPTAVGLGNTNYGYLYDCMPNFSSTSIFGSVVIDILDYTNTSKYKNIKGIGGTDGNGDGGLSIASVLYMSTSKISSISLIADAGKTYNQYTQFALYGILG